MTEALEQAPLFDESQLPVGRELLMPIEEQRHRFSGELVARNQARYQAIVAALGEGISMRSICKAFAVSQHTVEGIRERDAALVATEKERTGRKLRLLVRMAVDRLQEAFEKNELSAGQLPVTLGILVDKSLNWEGQSTQTVTLRHEIDQSKVLAFFASLAAPLNLPPGPVLEAVEVTPDYQSGDSAAKAPPIATSSGRGAIDGSICGPPAPTTTSSLDPGPPPAVSPADLADLAAPPQAQQAGGGVAVGSTGRQDPMGRPSENLDANEL